MNLLPLVLFVGVPVIISLILGRTLRYLPFLKRLRRRANEWDAEQVKVPVDPLTLKTLRTHANWGDKTVVAHYFVTLIYDIEFRIRTSLLIAALLSGVVVMFVVVINAPKGAAATQPTNSSPLPTPSSPTLLPTPSSATVSTSMNQTGKKTTSIQTPTSATPQPTPTALPPAGTNATSARPAVYFWEGLLVVLDQMPLFYLVPVSALILTLNSIFTVFNLFEQTNRYRRLVDE
jgi:hypothetical protein